MFSDSKHETILDSACKGIFAHMISQLSAYEGAEEQVVENCAGKMRLLVERGFSVKGNALLGSSAAVRVPLLLACKLPYSSRRSIMATLLELGVTPHAVDEHCMTALHMLANDCCAEDAADAMRLLVAYGADVNAKNSSRATPLHAVVDDDIDCAVHGSRQWRRSEAARVLLDAGADVNARDCDGFAPLHYAAAAWQTCVGAVLIDGGADVNARASNGMEPLHSLACQTLYGTCGVCGGACRVNDAATFMRMLVIAGANVAAFDNNGRRPIDVLLDMADTTEHTYRVSNMRQLWRTLVLNGARLNDSIGSVTWAHLAISVDDVELFKTYAAHCDIEDIASDAPELMQMLIAGDRAGRLLNVAAREHCIFRVMEYLCRANAKAHVCEGDHRFALANSTIAASSTGFLHFSGAQWKNSQQFRFSDSGERSL